MPFPLRIDNKNLILTLANSLYPLEIIEGAMSEFSISSKKLKRNTRTTTIDFGKSNLKNVLEFTNYLLSLNR